MACVLCPAYEGWRRVLEWPTGGPDALMKLKALVDLQYLNSRHPAIIRTLFFLCFLHKKPMSPLGCVVYVLSLDDAELATCRSAWKRLNYRHMRELGTFRVCRALY